MINSSPRVHFQAPYEIYLDPKPVADSLLKLSMDTGYDIIQKNGQRHFGPPPFWDGPPPAKGSEVFVGRLPRDCFENEIVPVFGSIGLIYEIRMMMNFTGFNRGFAFVTFSTPDEAWKAVEYLNNIEIRPGHKVGVSKSIDNCRLYFGGCPLEMGKFEAWRELSDIIPYNIKDVIMYSDVNDSTKNRGFFFVEFESHREAAMAKRALTPGTVKFNDKDIIVDWADPEPDVNPKVMNQISKLFIRNINSNVNSERLRGFIFDCVPQDCVTRVYCAGHYAFVHFNDRAHAEIAKESLSRRLVNGQLLEVAWARPKMFKKQAPPTVSKCRSLPPRFRRLLEQEQALNSASSENVENNNNIPGYVPVSNPLPDVIPMPTYNNCCELIPPGYDMASGSPAMQVIPPVPYINCAPMNNYYYSTLY